MYGGGVASTHPVDIRTIRILSLLYDLSIKGDILQSFIFFLRCQRTNMTG